MEIELNQKGTVMTEIVCIVVLVGIAAVASLGFIGTSISNKFTSTANDLKNGQDNAGYIPGCNTLLSCQNSPASGNGNPPGGSAYNSSSGPYGGYNPGLGGGNN